MDFVLVPLLRVNTGGVSFDMLNDTQLLLDSTFLIPLR